MMTPGCPSHAGDRFPAEIIRHAMWLCFRFSLSLRMVDELLAARGILVSHGTVRQWALKFGCSAAIRMSSRIGSSGMRPNGGVLPHLICSPSGNPVPQASSQVDGSAWRT